MLFYCGQVFQAPPPFSGRKRESVSLWYLQPAEGSCREGAMCLIVLVLGIFCLSVYILASLRGQHWSLSNLRTFSRSRAGRVSRPPSLVLFVLSSSSALKTLTVTHCLPVSDSVHMWEFSQISVWKASISVTCRHQFCVNKGHLTRAYVFSYWMQEQVHAFCFSLILNHIFIVKHPTYIFLVFCFCFLKLTQEWERCLSS